MAMVNKRLRRIASRDDWTCQLCYDSITRLEMGFQDSPSADHIIPKSWGSPEAMWNMRAAHARCNHRRQNKVTDRDCYVLARNIHIIMGGSEEDRLASAKQLIEAYREDGTLLSVHGKDAVPEDKIPSIVLGIRQGRFPWG